MNRNKRHKVKKELPESCSHNRQEEDHDLAYYIHDRVELMHQVFSVLKYKELKAMVPTCIRNISIDDLQELCTEELLGISSKRLCAILDGAEPPSDTESSSQSPTEQLETISLDSISSDEAILSQEERSKKKKHKHRRRNSKSKRRKSKDTHDGEQADQSTASRAGLTVLELLELQARARAIRAQLQQEQSKIATESAPAKSLKSHSSEDEVEIKEEPAEVVEISSDDEKPKIEDLELCNPQLKSPEIQSTTVTKRVKDLVITVPQQKTQKIKLNRTKSAQKHTDHHKNNDNKVEENTDKASDDISKDKDRPKEKPKDISGKKDKSKKKKKKRLSHASDNDEITLQLSDTEKMDLLEDLDRKSYDNYSSDSSSDSESDTDTVRKVTQKKIDANNDKAKDKILSEEDRISKENSKFKQVHQKEKQHDLDISHIEIKNTKALIKANDRDEAHSSNNDMATSQSNSTTDVEIDEKNQFEIRKNVTETLQSDDVILQNNLTIENTTHSNDVDEGTSTKCEIISQDNKDESISISKLDDGQVIAVSLQNIDPPTAKTGEKSEGEISDRESSEVEAHDLKPEVVCISDEEAGKTRKKKKKKEKKAKKEKSRKKSGHESSDQNLNKTDVNILNLSAETTTTNEQVIDSSQLPPEDAQKGLSEKHLNMETEFCAQMKSQESDPEIEKNMKNSSLDLEETPLKVDDESYTDIVEISDEVYELSDDSSNEDEADTTSVLSKEPTAAEIEALSAKIDEIQRTEVITEEEIREYEAKKANEDAMSWKDRYLDSKKVKRVLNTSNILNALRKKNIQIKRKLNESKVDSQNVSKDVEDETKDLDVLKCTEMLEGSIDQYNTLLGSTKFVDPVKEGPINDTLKKDAKQLLKMYKKLLKYNDINRKRDPNKKKKKKRSKKEKEQNSLEDIINQPAQN